MAVYYNDSEPFVCAWLRNLIAAKLLPAGDVDERSIQQVAPDDVRPYMQAHFFAGIGGWPYALQLAGWGDRPVWTGSCPCQPFSAAGQQKSHADGRHLWPAWYDLIRERHPLTIFGEQVSSAAGLGWLDAVAMDLEAADYAVGASVLGAHSVGAPHQRQRLYFVGESTAGGWRPWRASKAVSGEGACGAAERSESLGSLANGEQSRLEGHTGDGRDRDKPGRHAPHTPRPVAAGSAVGDLADADGGQPSDGELQRSGEHGLGPQDGGISVGLGLADGRGSSAGREAAAPDGHGDSTIAAGWAACDLLPCRDGKARPVEPGTFPLAHGIPARVGRLRAYGNAVVPQVAAAFVSAFMECCP